MILLKTTQLQVVTEKIKKDLVSKCGGNDKNVKDESLTFQNLDSF